MTRMPVGILVFFAFNHMYAIVRFAKDLSFVRFGLFVGLLGSLQFYKGWTSLV
jgi:hypothetical protein